MRLIYSARLGVGVPGVRVWGFVGFPEKWGGGYPQTTKKTKSGQFAIDIYILIQYT